ncbi:MAG: hypothetical protein ACRD1C_11025 [Terriglobales bacterium]
MFEEDTTPPKPAGTGMSPAAGWWLLAAIIVVALGGFFWVRQQNQALITQLAALQQESSAQTAEMHALGSRLHVSAAEMERLTATANDTERRVSTAQQQLASTQKATQTLAQQQQAAAQNLAQIKQDTGTQLGAINGQISGVKGNVTTNSQAIADTKADLASTKAQLKSTIGDLGMQSGLIATTRDQLTVLEKSGEHAYYQFKLDKHAKKPVRVGALWLKLTHVDPKHGKYNVDVYVNDTRIQKKNKYLDEPVQFLVGSDHALNELVVYQMDKNTVTGYVSAPKYPTTSAGN